MKIITENIDRITEICRNHQVKNLYVFGSVLTDRFSETSDIDFVVEFEQLPPLEYMDNYFAVRFGLEDLFDRKVDLLEMQTIDNPIFKEVLDRTKELIYDRRDQELVA